MSEPAAPSRAVPFHPPLIAAFPVLAIFSANTGLFPISELWRPVVFSLVSGSAVWALLALVRRSWEKGAIVASTLLAGVWLYSPALGSRDLDNLSIGLIFAAIGALGWFVSTRKKLPTRELNAFGALLTLVAGGSIGYAMVRPAGSQPEALRTRVQNARPPDVVYLLLDGYGREDQVRRVMNYDNAAFIAALRKRGFFVADRGRSNYCQTALSVSSILNTTPIQELVPNGDKTSDDRAGLNALVDRPSLVRRLRAIGYDSIAIGTGFPGFSFAGFDLFLQTAQQVSYFESTVLEHTPFGLPQPMNESLYDQRRKSLLEGFSALKSMASATAKPRFIFAHILAPHPPFVFGPNGEPVRQGGNYGFWDGSDYRQHIGSAAKYREGYVGQLRWLNGQVLEAIDALLARPGRKPIIVLQGDHGSKLGLDQNSLAKSDLKECFGTLSAYLAPAPVTERLTEDITALNAMRAIAGYVLGEDLPPVPDRSYYSPFIRPFALEDVTDRVR